MQWSQNLSHPLILETNAKEELNSTNYTTKKEVKTAMSSDVSKPAKTSDILFVKERSEYDMAVEDIKVQPF